MDRGDVFSSGKEGVTWRIVLVIIKAICVLIASVATVRVVAREVAKMGAKSTLNIAEVKQKITAHRQCPII